MTAKEAVSAADLMDEGNRKSLAKLVMRFFDRWEIDAQTQCRLLGMTADENGLAELAAIRDGGALPADTAMIERVGHLLAIYKAISILYGNNPRVLFRWITNVNKRFTPTPLDFILEAGDEGLADVRQYLDFLLVR